MLKGRLAARLPLPLLFLCLLSSVESDEGLAGNDFGYEGLPFLVSGLEEMCLERLDPLSCQYWNSIGYKTADSDSGNPSRQETPGKESTEEDASYETPVVEAENNFQKRFTVFRRKTSTGRGYKRGPGFRSWGGKRDFLSNPAKRSKFASWGGKRNGDFFPEDLVNPESFVKKPKFQNWGGKKSTDDFSEDSKDQMEKRGPIWKDRGMYLGEPFKKHVPKRPQFQSWGGKRTPDTWNKFLGFFYSRPRYLLNGGEKRKFSSWGGKRFDESESQQDGWMGSKEENPKRHSFQNWGGKRATSDGNANQKDGESEERPTERKKRDVEGDLGPRIPSEAGPSVWQSKR